MVQIYFRPLGPSRSSDTLMEGCGSTRPDFSLEDIVKLKTWTVLVICTSCVVVDHLNGNEHRLSKCVLHSASWFLECFHSSNTQRGSLCKNSCYVLRQTFKQWRNGHSKVNQFSLWICSGTSYLVPTSKERSQEYRIWSIWIIQGNIIRTMDGCHHLRWLLLVIWTWYQVYSKGDLRAIIE